MKPSAPTLRTSIPMRVAGDTCGLARKDQYAYWLESVGGQAAHWNAERKDPAAGFRGRSHHARIGAILIWENHNDPYRIWRGPTRSPDSSGEWLYLASSNVEAFATGETKRRFAPNELVFIDTRRPVTLSNSRYARTRYLAIPRSALPASIGATLFPSLDTITPSRPLGRMIHSHFQGIFDLAWNPAPVATDPADLVARQLLELLAVFCATGETETATDPISGIGAARYADVLNLMTWHCAEPGLAPEQIADRAGLSRSSLYRLFRARGTHFSRELLRIRLESARTLLGAVDERPNGITEVAMRCGFATPSVFSRQFHAAFDMTPSEYRRSLMRCG